MQNQWKRTKYPAVVGHEITGIVIAIGKNVLNFSIGDRVAAGPTYNSCRSCIECKKGEKQYCEKGTTEMYNMPDRLPTDIDNPTGPIIYGGYSNILVINQNYLVPDNIELDLAAPLLCAGLTTFTPLLYHKIGKGSRVGIAGIGGLGHLAVKFAKALGAEVTALTRTKDSINRLGADNAVLITNKQPDMLFDFILDTIPFPHNLDIYLNMLATHETL